MKASANTPPPMTRAQRRRLAAHVRETDAALRATRDAFLAARRPVRSIASARVVPPLAALLDPRFGRLVQEGMMAVCAVAHGVDGERRGCFGCGVPWSPDPPPGLTVLLELANPPSRGVAFLCRGCSEGGEVERRVLEGVRRDFSDDAELVPPSAIAPEGGTA